MVPYNCGNSAPLEEAAPTLRVIDSIPTGRGGLIQGLVANIGTLPRNVDPPFNGIEIVIRGGGRTYKTLTDGEGTFKIHVPPGRYKVRPVQEGWAFKMDSFTFENPENLMIENGGAAQVVFQRTPATAH